MIIKLRIINAILEKEKYGQLSPQTIKELETIKKYWEVSE